MTAPLVVGVCSVCDARRFPKPEWCPTCGSDRIEDVRSSEGTVEETTVLRHSLGGGTGPVRIGTVRLAGGAIVIARLESAAGEGARVNVHVVDGAPVARPSRRDSGSRPS